MDNKCILCENTTEVIYHERFKEKFHYCKTCEFISKDEKHILTKEEELNIYNYHNNSIEDPKYVEFFYKFLDDAVFPYVNKGKRGFDYGSGPSPVLAQILEKYHDYNMDIYDLFYSPEKTYQGKKYDLITSTELVEHIKNPIYTFKLFKELLAEEGIISIMTSFHKNNEEEFKNWHYIRDKSHISFYTSKTMESLADRIGLKLVYTNDIRYTTLKHK